MQQSWGKKMIFVLHIVSNGRYQKRLYGAGFAMVKFKVEVFQAKTPL